MRIRLILTIITVCIAIPVVNQLLHTDDINIVSAATPVDRFVERPSLTNQATSIVEVEKRQLKPLGDALTSFQDEIFGYQVNYPATWQVEQIAPNEVVFKSLADQAQVTVVAVGLLTNNDLASYVSNYTANETIITRQLLTINGFSAERVILYSDISGEQQTKFFLNTETSAYVIIGTGNRTITELIAQSLNTSPTYNF